MSEASAWSGVELRQMRRIVVGAGEDGRSAVTFDSANPHVADSPNYPGVGRASVWREARTVDFASRADGIEVLRENTVGGSYFYVVEIAGGVDIPLHVSPSIEYHCVVAGRIVCVLEDGAVEAGAGDLLIMRGVPHGWSNRGEERWVSVATMIDVRDSAGATGNPMA